MSIADIKKQATEKMGKAIEHTQSDFSTVRTGRATPALVEKLKVDYYGTDVPLQQLAGFSVPEGSTESAPMAKESGRATPTLKKSP